MTKYIQMRQMNNIHTNELQMLDTQLIYIAIIQMIQTTRAHKLRQVITMCSSHNKHIIDPPNTELQTVDTQSFQFDSVLPRIYRLHQCVIVSFPLLSPPLSL